MPEHVFPERRHTDPLLKELIAEMGLVRDALRKTNEAVDAKSAAIDNLADEMKPLKKFIDQVNSARRAFLWMIALLTLVGGLVTWILNIRDHLHH